MEAVREVMGEVTSGAAVLFWLSPHRKSPARGTRRVGTNKK